MRRTRIEHMSAGLAPITDIARRDWDGRKVPKTVIGGDVAPNFYPVAIEVWSSVMPCWAVVAAIRGAEPSVERSAADRRAAA